MIGLIQQYCKTNFREERAEQVNVEIYKFVILLYQSC